MSTNAYIFSENEKDCFIIDPGGNAEAIASTIESKGLSVQGILCTHGHLDHTSAVGPLVSLYSSGDGTGDGDKDNSFILAIHNEDSFYLGQKSEAIHRKSFASLGIVDDSFFQTIFNPSPEPTLLLKDGDKVPGTELTVLHTPGHTEGSVVFYHEKKGIVFSGDTLFYRGVGRTDLPGGSFDALMNSIQEILFNLPDSVKVYPGHGPDTTIEGEKKKNPFTR